jgi:hypothetical protein
MGFMVRDVATFEQCPALADDCVRERGDGDFLRTAGPRGRGEGRGRFDKCVDAIDG